MIFYSTSMSIPEPQIFAFPKPGVLITIGWWLVACSQGIVARLIDLLLHSEPKDENSTSTSLPRPQSFAFPNPVSL